MSLSFKGAATLWSVVALDNTGSLCERVRAHKGSLSASCSFLPYCSYCQWLIQDSPKKKGGGGVSG